MSSSQHALRRLHAQLCIAKVSGLGFHGMDFSLECGSVKVVFGHRFLDILYTSTPEKAFMLKCDRGTVRIVRGVSEIFWMINCMSVHGRYGDSRGAGA